ncbi:hypothetical protein GUJ93_ZPchr0014g47078 [Zizania palustris]|uniref:Uncharacterized protein n=1 Tax=Zizania palustris TaxID=103762 RepID=A0A8J5SWX1_ZIZPA|nr:hypothetical protein GUJ93_ZPchr0014g47078 [Zizania palustris]
MPKFESAGTYNVRNTRNVNRTGQPTGYKLVPGSNCLPLALPVALRDVEQLCEGGARAAGPPPHLVQCAVAEQRTRFFTSVNCKMVLYGSMEKASVPVTVTVTVTTDERLDLHGAQPAALAR